MTKRPATEFDEFLRETREESERAGERATFEAYGEHFRLALEVIRMRQAQRWTQQEFAAASGVQQSEISRIERGQANPTWRTVQMLATAARKTVRFVDTKPDGPRRGTRTGRGSRRVGQ